MTDVRAKLAEKGLTLPITSKPIAAYVPATRTGNLVFTAGQLPMVDGKIVREGKVGSDLTADEAKALAEICALNALAAVELVAPIDSIVIYSTTCSCKWSFRALYAYLGRSWNCRT